MNEKLELAQTNLGRFWNIRLIAHLKHLMGIEVEQVNAGDVKVIQRKISDVISVFPKKPDLSNFYYVHELLHTALFYYWHYLFTSVLPIEMLQITFNNKVYRIPTSLLSQSTYFAEYLAEPLDGLYRSVSDWGEDEYDLLGGFNLQESFYLKINHLSDTAEYSPSVRGKFPDMVCTLAARAILIQAFPDSERQDFSFLAGMEDEIIVLAEQLMSVMEGEECENKRQLKALVSRMSYLVCVLADRGYMDKGGVSRGPVEYSFFSWLSSLKLDFADPHDGALLEDLLSRLDRLVERDLAR
jgi:hypothetical protein